MPDFLSVEARSRLMAKIKGKNTKPEIAMRRLLRSNGIRFDGHCDLPGRPDFRIKGHKVVIFVDGVFWHGRDFESKKHKLQPYWFNKITNNMKRDRRNDRKLRSLGFSIIHVWEDGIDGSLGRIKRAMEIS
jgi:DNA mismatch endonuclease (patch repair protein)